MTLIETTNTEQKKNKLKARGSQPKAFDSIEEVFVALCENSVASKWKGASYSNQ